MDLLECCSAMCRKGHSGDAPLPCPIGLALCSPAHRPQPRRTQLSHLPAAMSSSTAIETDDIEGSRCCRLLRTSAFEASTPTLPTLPPHSHPTASPSLQALSNLLGFRCDTMSSEQLKNLLLQKFSTTRVDHHSKPHCCHTTTSRFSSKNAFTLPASFCRAAEICAVALSLQAVYLATSSCSTSHC